MARRVISAGPLPVFSHAFHRPGPRPFPFGDRATTFWYCARSAIFQGVRSLGLVLGDRVLAPAYACGSEIDALLATGVELDYYGVRSDLSADADHIADLCRRPARALFVTHYFGFAQDMGAIRSLAAAHGLLVIEDNAHGLYSRDAAGRDLGTSGDAAVFSLTKTLPVPDGGALMLNREDHLPVAPSRRPDSLAVAGKVRYLSQLAVEQFSRDASRIVRERVLDPLVVRIKSSRGLPTSNAPREGMDLIGFKPERADWGMSLPARAGARAFTSPRIPEIRRANYLALARGIEPHERLKPLLAPLPDGCSPMAFPVVVDDPAGFLKHLYRLDVRAKHFWSVSHPGVPMERFPFEQRLKRTVVALPVHQDLGEDDMARVIEATRAWCRGDASADPSVRAGG